MFVGVFFFFQAEDGIRDPVRSRGLGDVYKRQSLYRTSSSIQECIWSVSQLRIHSVQVQLAILYTFCLLYTSDAADERSSVDLGGRRIIKKKKRVEIGDSS